MLQCNKAVGAVPGLTMLINLVFKSTLKPGLCGKRSHKRQALDGLAEQTGQFAHFFLTAFGGRHHLGAKQADQPDNQRCQQQDGSREFPVQPEHVPQHRQQLERTWQCVVNRFVQHFADTIRVFGQSVREITC